MSKLSLGYRDLEEFSHEQMNRLRASFCTKSFEKAYQDLQKLLGFFQGFYNLLPQKDTVKAANDSLGPYWQIEALLVTFIPRLEWLVQRMENQSDVVERLAANAGKNSVHLRYDAKVAGILGKWGAEDGEDVQTLLSSDEPGILEFYVQLGEQLRMFMPPGSVLVLPGKQLRRISVRCFLMILDNIEYMASDFLSEEEYQRFVVSSDEAWYILKWLCQPTA